jgi:hypothetical protein
LCSGDEITRVRSGDLDHEHLVGLDLIRDLAALLGLLILVFLIDVDVGEQFDDDAADRRIPGDGHGADSELLGDRCIERFGIASGG